MNIVFSSDKKEYNTIKKGTEILLAEMTVSTKI